MQKHERIKAYSSAYLGDYGFESVMVEARQNIVLEIVESRKPSRILEVGCGADLLCEKAVRRHLPFAAWVIAEPSPDFAAIAERFAETEKRLTVRRGFFEDEAADLSMAQGPFDLVVVSGLLGELAEPRTVLRAATAAVDDNGLVHVSVPNAYSLHRRLARAMGLIEDEHAMTERNRLLQQHRVYDPATLRADVEASGLTILDEGGYFLKPFTHAQMEKVIRQIGADILPALWTLGRELPELASEIYVNARRTDGQ